MISIEMLRLYVSIVQAGSIAGGARSIRISQSLASRKIRALEQDLRARLLMRSTRQLHITEAGETFLVWAKETLTRFDAIVDELRTQRASPSGLIKIACNDYLGDNFLMKAVDHFRRTNPDLTFLITISDTPLELLDRGYDIAIHAGSLPGPAVVGRRLYSYRRIICASPDYLRGVKPPKAPADLAHHICLVHSRNDTTRWCFQRVRDGRKLIQPIASAIEVNSYPMLLNLGVRGLGIIRIAEVMARNNLQSGRLVRLLSNYRSIEHDGSDPAIWLTYLERPLLARVRLVADHLAAILRTIDVVPSG
ncbi:MAG: LysR family transcriptional regulator [Bradyrhizobiaceae bacterium]|nr:LysR family transcriptional regulator [Bradyrhizobiaceae bacterium]